jgi:hypothetical protein
LPHNHLASVLDPLFGERLETVEAFRSERIRLPTLHFAKNCAVESPLPADAASI